MAKFIAFLRGINVGGGNKVPMKELKTCFEGMGFTNVNTLLNTGNVVFDGNKKDLSKIPDKLEKEFGFTIETLIYSFSDIEKIVQSNPFEGIERLKDFKLYVSFYIEIKKSSIIIPFTDEEKGIKILKIIDIAIISMVDIKKSGTIELMKLLEREFGKKLTTRNFNTVQKLIAK